MRPALVLLALAALLLGGLAAPPPARAVWPTPVFEDHIAINVSPALPTQDDTVTITITSRNSSLFIKGATIYLTIISPENVSQGPYPYPMVQGVTPLQYSFTVPAYPNGTRVRFYLLAWDFDNDILTSQTQEYGVQGVPTLGWQHATFEENVEVTMFPPLPQPHDEVTVSIRSREPQVSIVGANLYLKYIYQAEPPKAGGFVMVYVNATHLAASIPGFPPGTEVIFWIVAWDRNVDTITSAFHAYNLSVDKYTRHENDPFPQVATYAGTSIGLALLVPVVVYFVDARRRRRAGRKEG